MSTSLAASRMQAVADDHNLPIEVKAFSDSKLDIIIEQYHPECHLCSRTSKSNTSPMPPGTNTSPKAFPLRL